MTAAARGFFHMQLQKDLGRLPVHPLYRHVAYEEPPHEVLVCQDGPRGSLAQPVGSDTRAGLHQGWSGSPSPSCLGQQADSRDWRLEGHSRQQVLLQALREGRNAAPSREGRGQLVVDPMAHAQQAHRQDALLHCSLGAEGRLGGLEVQQGLPTLVPGEQRFTNALVGVVRMPSSDSSAEFRDRAGTQDIHLHNPGRHELIGVLLEHLRDGQELSIG